MFAGPKARSMHTCSPMASISWEAYATSSQHVDQAHWAPETAGESAVHLPSFRQLS